jgi:hypothetical protein
MEVQLRVTRKITYAEWEVNAGQTTDAHGKGTVTVYYSSGRNDTFFDIDRGEFFEWEGRKWDYRKPPEGVRTRPPIID